MMAKSQELANFEHMIEKIIFNEDELKELKIAIKNFTEGKTSAKELKQLLLQCRGRMTEDVTYFTSLFVENKTKTLLQSQTSGKTSTEVESQLRKEIQEKNELLETVARRVNTLVSRLSNESSSEDKKLKSIGTVTEEIERCLTQIGAEQWIKMSYYEDYKFFVKLYPKLEELYRERFGENDNKGKDSTEGKEIMANKMIKLGFPEEIETMVIKYIAIRNKFQHSMDDLSPSHLELARNAFVRVFLYLIVSNLKTEFLSGDREDLYDGLAQFFSRRLTGNPTFRKEIVEQLKVVF